MPKVRVRCIANEPLFIGTQYELVIGKVYEVLVTYNYGRVPVYRIANVSVHTPFYNYWASNFVVVSCPCGIQYCLKHKK